jgi:hypothetical protein
LLEQKEKLPISDFAFKEKWYYPYLIFYVSNKMLILQTLSAQIS